MQENSNFDTIINNWRRMSEEQQQGSIYVSMSGGSPDFQVHGKRDEETFLSEKLKGPIATVASASTASAIADTAPNDTSELEEKLLSSDKEENKDGQGAGDATNKDKDDPNYSENNGGSNGTENKPDKQCDKVDSVFVSPSSPLKPPPPQSVTSNQQEDDECIVKCLYYTLQCCDCVLM